ncbi:uncharacterized protein B0H18DRAFT_960370 [Fomitopsis serialis]|uniref:uncharacterized protein n=1 Tax=Fomitopsis serialis TaxID=139415 RepID=UPI002007802B|nr:uncharacterized protein B0H18DRAFT_960370 [Neoantrodia serialis]KAH9913407.1 hypothetical protein B0H18DRAFT_960370 [Neoantrodia serialis]
MDMKRPCSVGDLQKGESIRQSLPSAANDSTLTRSGNVRLVVSYDIASHQDSCQTGFSFNYTKGVGRTDGEAVERGWAAVNGFSGSTKEMGPGSRRDVLDDAFGDYNWRKVTHLAKTLLGRVKNAVEECSKHAVIFDELTAVTDPTRVAEWKQQVEAWEEGADLNPFVVTRHPVTLAAVRRELAEEESTGIADGSLVLLHEKITPSILITAGLEMEEAQRRLQSDAAGLTAHSPDDQRASIIRRRNNLQVRIDAWRETQDVYMPGVAAVRSRAAEASAAPVLAENIRLYLPSAVLGDSRVMLPSSLLEIERRLRFAQANDSLEQLRRHLRARTKLFNIKDRDVRGQRYNTRSRAYIDSVQAKIDADAERYRAAHAALLIIDPGDVAKWQKVLKPLLRTDVRAMHQGLDDETEGRKTLSWIWRTSGASGSVDDEDDQEAVRIEWCKARARAMRWDEECQLLSEEMRRVLAFFKWHIQWWLHHAGRQVWEAPVGNTTEHAEGRRAYARRQADVRQALHDYCVGAWCSVPEYLLLRTTVES